MKGDFSLDRAASRSYARIKRLDRQALLADAKKHVPLPPTPPPEQWARAMAETGGKTIAAAELIAQWNVASRQNKP